MPDRPGLELFPSFRLSDRRRRSALLSNVILSLNYSARVARPSCGRTGRLAVFSCAQLSALISRPQPNASLLSVVVLHMCLTSVPIDLAINMLLVVRPRSLCHVMIVAETGKPALQHASFRFYPRDAMLARVFATATCPSVCPSVCLSHAGIVPSRAKAGS